MAQSGPLPGTWRHLVVIGGSAGAHAPLQMVCAGLPASFPAPVLVSMHIPASPSILGNILDRSGPLEAAEARDGEPLLPGRIYVAPPDQHLKVSPTGCVELDDGPAENRHRPAIDPLFGTAARVVGRGTIGVLLSGGGADGTEGAKAIAAHGGTMIVQDPHEASAPSMPSHALRHDDRDLIERAADIAGVLTRLTDGDERTEGREMATDTRATVECALWTALRLFEREASSSKLLRRRAEVSGHRLSEEAFDRNAQRAAEHAAVVRRALDSPAFAPPVFDAAERSSRGAMG